MQTWNAESNEPMLRINRALGFEPVAAVPELVPAASPRYPDRNVRRGARGAGLRGWPPTRHRHRPRNLNRVMPAEGIVSMAAPSASDMVVVITGGDPVDARPPARAAGRHPRDRGRLRRRPRAGARASRSTSWSATSTRRRRSRWRRPRRQAPSIERHPAAKDATDLELALDAAAGAWAPAHDPRARRPRRPPRPPARQRPAARPPRARRRHGHRADGRGARRRRARRRRPSTARSATSSRSSRSTDRRAASPPRGLLYPLGRRGPRSPAPPAASATSSSTTPPPSPSPRACSWPSSPASSAPTTRRPPDDPLPPARRRLAAARAC